MPFKINPQNSAVEYTSSEPFYNLLSADQTVNNSATVVVVPELQFTLAKYQRVEFNYELWFTTTAAAGFRYLLTIPGTLTQGRLLREHVAPDALTAVVAGLDITIDGTTNRTITCASGTDGFARGTGIIQNGATAGIVQLSFAQNAATAVNTTVRAGSFLTGTYI
jgi:hypothetical protein